MMRAIINRMAEILAADDTDLGDERAAMDRLAAEFPVGTVRAHVDEIVERARVLRAGSFEVALS